MIWDGHGDAQRGVHIEIIFLVVLYCLHPGKPNHTWISWMLQINLKNRPEFLTIGLVFYPESLNTNQ